MRFRNHHAGCCGFNPTHPDGTEWAHLLTLHDGSTVHADTAAEIIEELVPGYTSLPADTQRRARVRLAERLAAASQEARIQAAVAAGRLDPSDPDQAALLDVLRADKGQGMFLEREDAPGTQADWVPEPALVLLDCHYAPAATRPRIGGNVYYLATADDEAFLASLTQAQIFDYWASPAGQRP